ncbi:hypothetical protein F9K94_04570 [Brucella tritici]|uniref:Uncharacterized protein n=1 Tax=Brucella tritici TaxID=94626 RepID=A0A7V7VYS6_9HYPH|nr:hypothetical protein F9K94_04570 [Brucella tritici]
MSKGVREDEHPFSIKANILLALSTTCPHPIPLFPYSPIPLFPYSPIPLFPYCPTAPHFLLTPATGPII